MRGYIHNLDQTSVVTNDYNLTNNGEVGRQSFKRFQFWFGLTQKNRMANQLNKTAAAVRESVASLFF